MLLKETHTKVIEGHPIHTYLVETDLIHMLIAELNALDPKEEFQPFYNVFNQLATVEKRFERKENQLFPFLEQKGWNGPSQNMWSFHDTIREMFRIVRKNIADKDFTSVKHNLIHVADRRNNHFTLFGCKNRFSFSGINAVVKIFSSINRYR